MRRLLRLLGYRKVETGHDCGRHWLVIDGHVFAQCGPGTVNWMPNEWVRCIVKALDA